MPGEMLALKDNVMVFSLYPQYSWYFLEQLYVMINIMFAFSHEYWV